jgi:antitoxin CptB
MMTDLEYKRICWASRRGMLELDLMLAPFVENKLRDLSAEDQQRYTDLMSGEDNDLFAWMLGHKRPEDPELTRIVDQIVEHSKNT